MDAEDRRLFAADKSRRASRVQQFALRRRAQPATGHVAVIASAVLSGEAHEFPLPQGPGPKSAVSVLFHASYGGMRFKNLESVAWETRP